MAKLQSTLVFLRKDDVILLGMKKRSFGQGKWNGIGGKPHPGESIEDTAHRELEEEIGVQAKVLVLVARIEFEYFANPHWNQIVSIYFCTSWEGEPSESDEMIPQWFAVDSLPYTKMWPDDFYWMPKILTGKKVIGNFIFGVDEKISDFTLEEVTAIPVE